MKAKLRMLAALTLLTLLFCPAALATSAEQDLYAPFTSDLGEIAVLSVIPISVYNAEGISKTTQAVEVTLDLPAAFLTGVSDPLETLSDLFTLMSLNGFISLDDYTPDTTHDSYMTVRLYFSMPAGTEFSEYRLVYGTQVRALAETGAQPEAGTIEPMAAASDAPADTAAAAPADDVIAQTETGDEAAAPAEDIQDEEEADEAAAIMDAVLEALDEPLYTATYAELAQGGVIQVDDRTDSAKGLQTLLAAFGYSISTDGWAGGKTFEKLQNLQGIFGLEPTETVTAPDFQYLLQCLLIYNDADTAYELLSGTALDSDEFDYLQGCCAFMRELYYTASDLFYYSDWEDWETRMEACAQPWPDKGEVYHNPDYRGDSTTLKIKVDNQDEGYATYFKLYTEDGDFVSGLFVDGSGTVSADLPGGTYVIKMGTGETWWGPQEAFGDEGYYETLLFTDDEPEVHLSSGYEYTLTINTSMEDPDADDVNSEYTDFGEF
jgi:hypothetical protein